MNFFMLTLVLVLCQNQNVNGDFLKFIAARFSDLAYSFTSTVDTIRAHVQHFLKFNDVQKTQPHFVYRRPLPCNKNEEEPPTTKLMLDKIELTDIDEIQMEDTMSHMSTPQLASSHGREVESHSITTKDGYVLTAHRIIPKEYILNRTVILHHGLLGSSADWLLRGPLDSLPYMLTDAGYDVWMANARGNYYSRTNTFKKITTDEFWNFSWQEMGEFDLVATIDYIRTVKKFNITGETIDYIGHSMGSTSLLVLLSVLPSYNQYLRIGVLLAPLAYMTNSQGPLKALMSMSQNPPEHLLKVIGNTEFLPSRRLPKGIAMKYCEGPLLFCCNPLFFISGGISNAATWDQKFVDKIMYHIPAGASTATLVHYSQLVRNAKFHKYNDMDTEFPLSQITLPIALISSDTDWLASIPDVLRLYFSIVNPIDHYIIRGRNFSHTEFVWSPDVRTLVFNKVIEYLESEVNWISIKNNEVTVDKDAL